MFGTSPVSIVSMQTVRSDSEGRLHGSLSVEPEKQFNMA